MHSRGAAAARHDAALAACSPALLHRSVPGAARERAARTMSHAMQRTVAEVWRRRWWRQVMPALRTRAHVTAAAACAVCASERAPLWQRLPHAASTSNSRRLGPCTAAPALHRRTTMSPPPPSTSLTEEQLHLLGLDEAGGALLLSFLAAGGAGSGSGGSGSAGGASGGKDARHKEKKAAKDERKAAAKAKEPAQKAPAKAAAAAAAAPARTLEAEIDVGTSFDVATLTSSSDLPASALPPGAPRRRYYLTTAINYTNGNPHIGHAYEAIASDAVSRYFRMAGREVFFQTGTDEHGQKIAATAEAQGKQPIDICDFYAGNFQELNKRLHISNNYYIRTTQKDHHKGAQALWLKCAEAGDIYLGKYEGWYNVREETFVSDKDAEQADFKDAYGTPLKRTSEASYFFRMGKYQEWLVKYLNDHPEFIQPADKRAFILGRLSEPLGDLSISRTTFTWGIPVPEGFDASHVMYVWFDALSNYTSSIHALDPSHPLSSFWPADCHVIGKDITWFHCVIWPCMLRSAGLPLPKTVFAHGFISGADGRKMSKSLGNVVDPHDLCGRYPVDSLRWYMLASCPFGADLAFSVDALVAAHNADLCDTLGNLVHRAVNLNAKYSGGKVPAPQAGAAHRPFDLNALRECVEGFMAEYNVQQALQAVMAATRDTNKFLTDAAPWHIKGSDDAAAATRAEIVRATLDAVYCLAHFLAPAMPAAATAILCKCGAPARALPALSADFTNLAAGTSTHVGKILFNKLDAPDAAAQAADSAAPSPAPPAAKAAAANGKPAAASEGGKKKEKGGDNGKKAKGGAAKDAGDGDGADQDEWTKIDIRVGKIVKVWHHPDSDKLFCEEVDVGEDAPRPIASGLRAHHTLDEMDQRLVCVVCNLKPAKLGGFTSDGMVLAAKGADGKVELLRPPAGAAVGERLRVDGLSGEPLNPNQVKKKKAWEALAPALKVDASGAAVVEGRGAIVTSAGPCTADTVRDGVIS